ncbi:ADP-ribosylation factor [Spraguea lophii 42_110]|uniref:ADP-ribosylation factor n=1 Tax=Spraguea lophii (strain 42_110) TaxID=1358809 RepID=S7WB00_SPRLO|nr:ADP-ribosylation factor [Spraguea lophii 42_110]
MNFSAFIKKLKKERNELRLITIGLDNAGKTTILKSMFDITDIVYPTFGYLTHEVNFNDHILTILDIGGQKSIRKYWNNFFEKADGLIFVVDLTDTRDFIPYLQHVANDPFLDGVPLLILGNKWDLKEESDGLEICNRIEKAFDSEIVKCYPVSAKLNKNLNESFKWLTEKIESLEKIN